MGIVAAILPDRVPLEIGHAYFPDKSDEFIGKGFASSG